MAAAGPQIEGSCGAVSDSTVAQGAPAGASPSHCGKWVFGTYQTIFLPW